MLSPPASMEPITVSALIPLFAPWRCRVTRRSTSPASPTRCASNAAGNSPAHGTRFGSSNLTDTRAPGLDGAGHPIRDQQGDRDPRPAPPAGRAATTHATPADELDRPRRDRRPAGPLPVRRRHGMLATPPTILRWHRDLVARRWTTPPVRTGRPAIPASVRAALVIRLASDNPTTWRSGHREGSRTTAWTPDAPRRQRGTAGHRRRHGRRGQPERAHRRAQRPGCTRLDNDSRSLTGRNAGQLIASPSSRPLPGGGQVLICTNAASSAASPRPPPVNGGRPGGDQHRAGLVVCSLGYGRLGAGFRARGAR
jgi:hypothetical protein